MTETLATHTAIIGAGPGGYAAAFHAADLGLDVTLIDVESNPGGTCLYRGCIPSKALLHVSKLLEEAEQAKNWGVEFAEPKVDLNKLRGWKESIVKRLTGGLGQLAKQRSVQFVQGKAAFVNSTTLKVTRATAGGEEAYGIKLIAPNRGRRSKTQDRRPLRCYKRRWKVERLFAWMHNFRRLVTRWEYHIENFLGFVHLACLQMLFKRL